MTNLSISKDVISTVIKDDAVRRELSKDSHYWFFHIYFSHYVEYATADFQKEIFAITEQETTPLSVIVAFRGCGKSSIVTTSYPIWAILGKQQKKLVVILSQTQRQARQHLANLKQELETNELLRRDLGPFKEVSDEWGQSSLVIPKHDARIVSASTEQSIRGLRHGPHRPDLIICDDVEDIQSTKTREGRAKTYDWFNSEIVPLGGGKTKIVMVGNLLHGDSLLMKLRELINKQELDGLYREYPLVRKSGKILWQSRFADMQAVEQERKKIASEEAWQREYMLKIITTVEQVVDPKWIKYYHEVRENRKLQCAYIGTDLAVSQKDSADYTAMVLARVYGSGDAIKIYIEPYIFNKRITFPECVEHIKTVSQTFLPLARKEVLIEGNGYQQAMAQQLSQHTCNVRSVSSSSDKRTRLALCTDYMSSSKILFPAKGAEQLIEQLLGFGKEKHDDLVDAFTIIILKVINQYGGFNGSTGKPSLIRFGESGMRRRRRIFSYFN